MPASAKKLISLAVAFLVTAFIAGPTPAAAEDGVKFDLRIHGGFSRLAAGDVNTGSGGLFEFYELFSEYGDYGLEGGYEPLHGGYDFGADAVFPIGKRFGIGLGVGYLHSAGKAEMTLTPPDSEALVFDGGPVLSAFPIRLGLFYSLPLVGHLNLTANAGGAFYAGLRFKDRFHVEADSVFSTQEITGTRTSLANLGFQGGLGLEYEFSEKTGLFVELQGRYARFKNFGSVSIHLASAEGGSDTREGKLYLRTQTLSVDPPIAFDSWNVTDTPPVPDPPDIVFREPEFDLSGFCLQVGVRIRI